MPDKLFRNAFRTIIISFLLTMFSMCVVSADFGDTILKRNMNHPDVASLEERLSKLGYLKSSEVDNLFDSNTESALKKFQKEYNIDQDGIAGKDTIRFLNVAYKQHEILSKSFKPLKKDDKGEKVSDIQKKLKAYGVFSGEITDTFGEKTETAVKEFQKQFGLSVTGIVDVKTYSKLEASIKKESTDRASAARTKKNLKLVSIAKNYLGTKYVWGSSSAKGFDCSGFTRYVLNNFGVKLDHRAGDQFNSGVKVDRNKLWPGDLVFFKTSRASVGHVGIYIGNDKFIHASSSKRKVVIDSLSQYSKYSKYIGARRFDLK